MVLRAALLAATMMVAPVTLAQVSGELKMVDEMQAATLKVPGATLYYEMRGKGPLLVIIPGGPQDAGVFAELAAGMADTHRVVAIDPRGNSRSMFDAAPGELDLGELADDVAALIGNSVAAQPMCSAHLAALRSGSNWCGGIRRWWARLSRTSRPA